MASSYRGVNKLRRTLRRIEPGITQGVRDDLKEVAESVKWGAISRVPRDEGDLARSIDYKFGRDGLTAVIGPSAKAADIAARKAGGSVFRAASMGSNLRISRTNREALYEFSKGYWIEYGTKGSPSRGIPGIRPQPFMRPAWDMTRGWAIQKMRTSLRTALQRAAR